MADMAGALVSPSLRKMLEKNGRMKACVVSLGFWSGRMNAHYLNGGEDEIEHHAGAGDSLGWLDVDRPQQLNGDDGGHGQKHRHQG